MAKQDFLSLLDFSFEDLDYLIQRGKAMRRMHEAGEVYQPLVGKTGALILQLSSTRTRVAFQAGLSQLGGQALFQHHHVTQFDLGAIHGRHDRVCVYVTIRIGLRAQGKQSCDGDDRNVAFE